MSELGFKKLTSQNWLESDPIITAFVKLTRQGEVRPISAQDLLDAILQPQLFETIPTDIKGLYEVARGAMCYGYFFYPLYTLATEQLYRVAETAVTYKCKQLRAPKKVKTFADKVDFLIQSGVIPKSEKLRWEGIRGLRNLASHPDWQSLGPPGSAVNTLEIITMVINQLFGAA